ncbi:MAG: thioredoxin family protein [Chloroflexi bacterium]|nr:thioredoxin family protein [Chloroflexota bacterium]
MSDFINIDETNFQSEVLESGLPVLLEFGAEWCGPCKMLEPVLKQLAQEWDSKLRLAKIDADQSVQIVMRYGVMGLPTLILFIGGQPRERISGYTSREKIAGKLKPHLTLPPQA